MKGSEHFETKGESHLPLFLSGFEPGISRCLGPNLHQSRDYNLQKWRHYVLFLFTTVSGVDIQCIQYMMTSSNGNIFRVTGPLCGEFTGPGEFPTQRPVTRSFDVYFDLRLNKRLSKQPWGWWFETPSWSLWRQRNDIEFACSFVLPCFVWYIYIIDSHFIHVIHLITFSRVCFNGICFSQFQWSNAKDVGKLLGTKRSS